MRGRLVLFALLVLLLVPEVSTMGVSIWLPDFTLLIIIFSSFFFGLSTGIFFALAGGVFRGAFSAYMLPFYLIYFPIAAICAAFLAKALDRYSSAVQMVMAVIITFLGVIIAALYFRATGDGDLRFEPVISHTWRMILTTVLIAPSFFFFLKAMAAPKGYYEK